MQRKGVMETFNMCMGVEPEIDRRRDKRDRVIALNNEIGRQENEPAFYYHSDHLGSASYVTNDDGASNTNIELFTVWRRLGRFAKLQCNASRE
jgi:hypothetical protein